MDPLLTIGHSTRSLDELIELLQAHRVEVLVDVRTVPGSRRMPHFSKASLERALPERGIAYVHLPQLGGLRRPRPDSINTGWRNDSFRGYADYMQQPEFEAGLNELIGLARDRRTAIMCAEAVPWRCHRSLIADALVARGIEVRHITGKGKASPHRLTPSAKLDDGRVSYPAPGRLPGIA